MTNDSTRLGYATDRAFWATLARDQVEQWCGCGRYLAWPCAQVGHDAPRCCRCMQPAEQCTCEPADQPAGAADCE